MSVVKQARDLLSVRLTELDKEKRQVERAMEALGPASNGSGPAPAKARRVKRRKRQGGTRLEEARTLIERTPGITAGEIAKQMRIKPNYLYRVVAQLEKDGVVRKSGRQLFPGKLTLRG
jgi:predicted HTH transcriptional regulator